MKLTPLHDWIGNRIGSSKGTFSRSEFDRFQLEKLNSVLQLVHEKSSFYQHRIADFPLSIYALEDLAAFPFTTAEDLRSDPNRFACVSQEAIQRIVTLPTSGTTGQAKRVFFTLEDQELTVDFFKIGMSTLAQPGDRVLILLPGQRPGSVGDLLKTGLERLGCKPTIHGPVENEEDVFKVIISKEINVLVGSPVHLNRLARLDDEGWVLPKYQIQKVLTSTDTLPKAIRASLQSIWGCEVFDHWGMTETGLGGGVECAAHQGLHLREADLFFEIIDPQSGQLLPDGEIGEVVITTLTRQAMPLVRYRTGDLSRLIPGVCACGSFIKRLDRITNRVNAGIQLGSGCLTQNDLDEALFQIRDILDFSAAFSEKQGKKVLTLAIRSSTGQFQEIEFSVFEALEAIPMLQMELANSELELEIIPVEILPEGNLHSMHKRRIQNQATIEKC